MAFNRLVFPTRSCPTTTSLTVELMTGSSCKELRYWRTSAARSGKSDGMLMSGLPVNAIRRSRLRADTETGNCDSLLLFTLSSSSDVKRPMSTGNSTSELSLHCQCHANTRSLIYTSLFYEVLRAAWVYDCHLHADCLEITFSCRNDALRRFTQFRWRLN